MLLDSFKDALDEHGFEYRETGKSIALKDCPACGGNKYKVLLKVPDSDDAEVLLGRCMRGRCGEGFSSVKYLVMMGLSREEALIAHGLDTEKTLESLYKSERAVPTVEELLPKKKPEIKVDLSGMLDLETWPGHPAAQYAKKRGAVAGLDIMIDPNSNAAVFLVKENNVIIGYQKRFLTEPVPGMKTQTSYGFEKSRHILEYPNKGHIVICEGPFTAVSAWHYGFHAICTFGSGVSDHQIDLISNLAIKNNKAIGIATEVKGGIQDEANAVMMERIRSALFWKKFKLFWVIPEVGKDLNDSWMAGKKYTIDNDYRWAGPALPSLNIF